MQIFLDGLPAVKIEDVSENNVNTLVYDTTHLCLAFNGGRQFDTEPIFYHSRYPLSDNAGFSVAIYFGATDYWQYCFSTSCWLGKSW